VKNFTLSTDQYTTGFQEHARIDLHRPIEDQLNRRRLYHRRGTEEGKAENIKQIIEHNASLRVDFGWSFESETHYKMIMDDCLKVVLPKYNINVGRLVSDLRCSWLGFEPHNMYDKDEYRDFSVYSLIIYNNEIIDFQIDIVKAMCHHEIYRQHALIRDEWYRFGVFKAARKDRAALAEWYQFYMNSIHSVTELKAIPRSIVEENIGTHFLHHPDLFFEMLEFSILKGEVYE
jgi:hypothetical protein